MDKKVGRYDYVWGTAIAHMYEEMPAGKRHTQRIRTRAPRIWMVMLVQMTVNRTNRPKAGTQRTAYELLMGTPDLAVRRPPGHSTVLPFEERTWKATSTTTPTPALRPPRARAVEEAPGGPFFRKEVIIHLLSEFDSFECAKALAHSQSKFRANVDRGLV